MSGHSKWSQIKHKKSITDQKKGALFSKIARELTEAARAGGPDTDINARLRASIEHARSSGLPKENIARAVLRASGATDADSARDFLYEAFGPEGVLILIEGTTDNKNRSLAEIRKILSDHGAKFSDPGAVLWNFEKRGLLFVRREDSPDATEYQIELAVIDAGARDYEKDGDVWVVETLTGETERVRHPDKRTGLRLPRKNSHRAFRRGSGGAHVPSRRAFRPRRCRRCVYKRQNRLTSMIILGIDPGTTAIGFAVLDCGAKKPILLDAGLLDTALQPPDRFLRIHDAIRTLISRWKPSSIAVEKLFFEKNKKTAMAVAEAQIGRAH